MDKQTDSMQIDNFRNIKMAQTDMKNSHFYGATGISVSGLHGCFQVSHRCRYTTLLGSNFSALAERCV